MVGIKNEVCYICMNLSSYVKSGITLSKSLNLIKETINDKKYKESLRRIEEKVVKGENLSDAFREEDKYFPSLMIDMIKIGEESGNLEEVLEKCSKTLIAEKDIQNKVLKAIRYPAVLLMMLVIMIFFYGTYILPQFIDMFDLEGKSESLIISVLSKYIDFVEQNPNIEIIAISYLICFIIFVIIALKFINFSKILERFEVYTIYYEVRVLFLINMILSSGISLTKALNIFGENLNDEKLKKLIKLVDYGLIKGDSLSVSLGRLGVISSVSKGFLVTGEESGRLNSNLIDLLNIREKDFEKSLNKLVGRIEPAMFGIIGGVISVMIILVLVPTFEGMKYV